MTVDCNVIPSTKNKTQVKRNAKFLVSKYQTHSTCQQESDLAGLRQSAETNGEGRGHRAHLRRDITRSRERAEAK